MKKGLKKTPVRSAMKHESLLLPLVVDGLGAVENSHKDYFDPEIRNMFADSLDLDKAMQPGHEQEHRWDYLLGHTLSGKVVAVEPHSAKQDQVSTVISKQAAARTQMIGHLRDGVKVAKWLWVASGNVHFANTEKTKRILDQNGIEFVGKRVTTKNLP